MTLTLEFTGNATVPVEVEGITPDAIKSFATAEIEQLEVFHGNEQAHLADFFKVSGDAASEKMVWTGDLTGVHWIGAKMDGGEIRIDGDAGRHIGSEMKAGTITVNGNVGGWLGSEMKGGLIHVHGDAGHLVGAAYRGSERGMNRGTILVDGNAGNEIGHTMRRGLIAIGGNTGDLIGFNMLAGTIVIMGEPGIRHGAGMRRGTIAFLGENHPELLPSFKFACQYRPEFMPVLTRHLASLDFDISSLSGDESYNLHHGDFLDGGRGEIITKA